MEDPPPEIVVVLAVPDLMTASKLAAPGVQTVRAPTRERAVAAAEADPAAPVVVDLDALPELPAQLRAAGIDAARIIAFAPHVQEDVLAAAREHAGTVLVRGAMVRRFDQVVREASAAAGG